MMSFIWKGKSYNEMLYALKLHDIMYTLYASTATIIRFNVCPTQVTVSSCITIRIAYNLKMIGLYLLGQYCLHLSF